VITYNVTDLGGFVSDAGAATAVFNTLSAVASGAMISLYVICGNGTGATLSSVSGGSLTWRIDASFVAQFFNCYLVSAVAPSGLASGTAITATYSINTAGRGINGMSINGVLYTSVPDAIGGLLSSATTAWTTPSMLLSENSILVAGAVNDTVGTSSTVTVTSPITTEHNDRPDATAGYSTTMASRIITSTGWYTVSGAWVASGNSSVVAAAYKADIPDVIVPSMVPVSMVGRSY
jgi:hypothetical protein